MKDYWKEELDLFKKDVEKAWDFLFQPVTFGKKDDILALRPNEEEIIEKAEAASLGDNSFDDSQGFWTREFNLLKKDVENAWDFLFQPVEIFKK